MDIVNFRPAKIEDLPILYEFEQGIVEYERPFDPTIKAGHVNYYDIKAMIESDDTEVLVALINDEIIASSYIKIKEAVNFQKIDHYGYIGFIFVKPEQRGKGISSMIMKQLKNWAKSRNLTELRLGVYEENLSAIKAYKKSGFKKHLVEMRLEI